MMLSRNGWAWLIFSLTNSLISHPKKHRHFEIFDILYTTGGKSMYGPTSCPFYLKGSCDVVLVENCDIVSFIARRRGPTLAKTGGGPRFPSFVQLMSGGSRSLVLLQISGYCEPLRRRCPQWMYWVATYTACLLRTGLQGWGRMLPRLEDHVMLLNHICSIYSKDW